MEKKCNDKLNIKTILFINPNDIKEFSKENGLVMKRKYGNLKREIFKYEAKERYEN